MNTLKKIAVLIVLPATLVLSACSVGGSSDQAPSSASAPAVTSEAPEPALTQKLLGEVVTYEDGLSVSVSVPTEYIPTAQAAGVTPGLANVIFNVLVTNDTLENVDLAGFPNVNSGGEAASSISDFGNDVGNIPYTTLLPGQSISFKDAYSVLDVNDITYLITPAFLYEQAIFTSN